MKSSKKVIISGLLTAVIAANLAITPVFAAANVTYNGNTTYIGDNNQGGVLTEPTKPSIIFSDVKAGDWYYEPVMAMAEMGLIGGTTTPVNGVGTYSPDSSMTKAQFVTILTRYLFPEDVKNYNGQYNAYWYSANYGVAIDKGLIKTTEFSEAAMDKPANRQEMSMMLVRSMEVLGMDTSAQTDKSAIPDYDTIGTYYRDYVRVAYKAGMIAGVDAAGTFNPLGTLNRAQAATVLNRLIDASTRVDSGDDGSFNDNTDTGVVENVPATGNVFQEGKTHSTPKVGDTVIKADGTKVVIQQKVVNGVKILAYGTGVDIWSGVQISGNTIKEGSSSPDGSRFLKSDILNEMHSETEWNAIQAVTNPYADPNVKITGDYNGDIYEFYWKWDANGIRLSTGEKGVWVWLGPKC